MARLIVKQPDGKYSMWSTVIDNFHKTDLTREQYIEFRAREEYYEKIAEMNEIFDSVESGSEMFTMDYKECLEKIKVIKKCCQEALNDNNFPDDEVWCKKCKTKFVISWDCINGDSYDGSWIYEILEQIPFFRNVFK